MTEPGLQTPIDFLVRRPRIFTLEILPHDTDTGLEQVQRDAKSLSRTEFRYLSHTRILTANRPQPTASSEPGRLSAETCLVQRDAVRTFEELALGERLRVTL